MIKFWSGINCILLHWPKKLTAAFCKGKTLLGVVDKLLNTKSLLTMPSNVLPLCLKQTFPPIIWIFNEGEGDVIKSRLSSKIFFTLSYLRALYNILTSVGARCNSRCAVIGLKCRKWTRLSNFATRQKSWHLKSNHFWHLFQLVELQFEYYVGF